MNVLVSIGRMFPCKLLTLVHKISERQIKVWCEVVKIEDFAAIARRRMEENPNFIQMKNWVSSDICISELQRIIVDIHGNSFIRTGNNETSFFTTFISAADSSYRFPVLCRKEVIGGPPDTTITYKLDSGSTLDTVFFNPWSIRKKIREDRIEKTGARNRETDGRTVCTIETTETTEDIIEEREDRSTSQRGRMETRIERIQTFTGCQFPVSTNKGW